MSLAEAAAWADLLVLAVPVEAMGDVLRGLAPAPARVTLLTDVASVKAPDGGARARRLPHPETLRRRAPDGRG